MTLYLGFDTAKLYRPVLHVSEFQGQGRSIAHNVTRAQPLLLMARLCLEQAFVVHCELRWRANNRGRDSYEWLS